MIVDLIISFLSIFKVSDKLSTTIDIIFNHCFIVGCFISLGMDNTKDVVRFDIPPPLFPSIFLLDFRFSYWFNIYSNLDGDLFKSVIDV